MEREGERIAGDPTFDVPRESEREPEEGEGACSNIFSMTGSEITDY